MLAHLCCDCEWKNENNYLREEVEMSMNKSVLADVLISTVPACVVDFDIFFVASDRNDRYVNVYV